MYSEQSAHEELNLGALRALNTYIISEVFGLFMKSTYYMYMYITALALLPCEYSLTSWTNSIFSCERVVWRGAVKRK